MALTPFTQTSSSIFSSKRVNVVPLNRLLYSRQVAYKPLRYTGKRFKGGCKKSVQRGGRANALANCWGALMQCRRGDAGRRRATGSTTTITTAPPPTTDHSYATPSSSAPTVAAPKRKIRRRAPTPTSAAAIRDILEGPAARTRSRSRRK